MTNDSKTLGKVVQIDDRRIQDKRSTTWMMVAWRSTTTELRTPFARSWWVVRTLMTFVKKSADSDSYQLSL